MITHPENDYHKNMINQSKKCSHKILIAVLYKLTVPNLFCLQHYTALDQAGSY